MTREPDPPLRRAGAHEQRRMNRLEMRPVTTRGIQLPDRRERLADLCGLLTIEDSRLADATEFVARSALVLPMGDAP